MRIGLVTGAIAGGVFGSLLNAICENETGGCPGVIVALGAAGAGIGAGIGAAADGLHHSTLYERGRGAPREFVPSVTASLGTARLQAPGFTARMMEPPSMSGSWTYLNVSGIGLDVSAVSAPGRATRSIDCVRVGRDNPFIAPSLEGTCAGPGVEGTGHSHAVETQALYAFGRGRVRPYLSGGVSIETRELQRSIAVAVPGDSSRAMVIHSTSHETGVDGVAGAGAWLTLVPRVALRPAVDVVWGQGATSVRARVGLSYEW
jgi:hypothetical protein